MSPNFLQNRKLASHAGREAHFDDSEEAHVLKNTGFIMKIEGTLSPDYRKHSIQGVGGLKFGTIQIWADPTSFGKMCIRVPKGVDF